MPTLTKSHRTQLQNAVLAARPLAEAAAAKALEALAVGAARPWPHLTDEQRALRRRLRAHGRSLGDALHKNDDTQSVVALAAEAAYQHWHRMLFARFLAENGFLLYDGVPVSLQDCAELAAEGEGGARDAFELAGNLAARMLPQIFDPHNPVLALPLAPEDAARLSALLAGLSPALFTASDALGWVYQYWQAARKDAVNKSGDKIGAAELPAVTQLFTEPYMVDFLLDQSIPAAPPPGGWGAFTVLDPCCGSGHFLVAAFERLVPLRMRDEGLRAAAAVDAVLRDNIHGLELDPRCVEIAAFALALAAWRWPGENGRQLGVRPGMPSPRVACCGLAVAAPAEEWDALAPADAPDAESLRAGMRRLHDLFVQAPLLGSLIDPTRDAGKGGQLALGVASFDALQPLLDAALVGEEGNRGKGIGNREDGDDAYETVVAARGLLDAARMLGRRYSLVITNPPYLARGKQCKALADFCAEHYPDAKNDLANVFLERCLELAQANTSPPGPLSMSDSASDVRAFSAFHDAESSWRGGERPGAPPRHTDPVADAPPRHTDPAADAPPRHTDPAADAPPRHTDPAFRHDGKPSQIESGIGHGEGAGGEVSLVLPQNWLFLGSYRKQRESLLRRVEWRMLARLGTGAFGQISGEVVNTILITLRTQPPVDDFVMRGVDASAGAGPDAKADLLRSLTPVAVSQRAQLQNPDARVLLDDDSSSHALLSEYSGSYIGMHVGGWEAYRRGFWEMPSVPEMWARLQGSVMLGHYSGMSDVAYWPDAGREHEVNPRARVQGKQAWHKTGVVISPMNMMPVALYTGELFDNNTAALIPHDPAHLPALWCYCSSPEYSVAVRQIDQSLKVTNATLVKVPFDLDRWGRVAAERYPRGLPRPYSDDPTQWIFHGHPCGSVVWDEQAKWTAHGALRRDASVLQVAVARLLGYAWPAERDDAMELSDESRAWAAQARALAGHADRDGIVCLPAVRGERPAHERLLALLGDAYERAAPGAWSTAVLDDLLTSAGFGGRTLEAWLRDGFFAQHCKLFGQRPFVWHVWDGLRDGFAALVNYHRLDHKTLEALIYSYLGDWIARQKHDAAAGAAGAAGAGADSDGGAQARLDAAEALQAQLKAILRGEAPLDIFVRWKPLAQQPVGWHPDLNDGVRLNIRPFLLADDVGKKGAGVLRERPNIKWDKDRGRDVPGAPWFERFGGERINDVHLRLEEKR